MQFNLNIDSFIMDHVTGREESLLIPDFEKFNNQLNSRINGKSVLVINGAGTIGSSYIKAILNSSSPNWW